MIANQLRYNITIYKQSFDLNEYGTQSETFSKYYDTKAGIKYESGGENLNNDRTKINQNLTFKIRNRKDKQINEGDRIEYNNTKYNIKEIIPDFDGVFKNLQIKTEKVIK
ncbi:MAG: phage head closure protein [bacterium]